MLPQISFLALLGTRRKKRLFEAFPARFHANVLLGMCFCSSCSASQLICTIQPGFISNYTLLETCHSERKPFQKTTPQNYILTKTFTADCAKRSKAAPKASSLLTIKRQLPSCHVPAPDIFSHALVEPSILLLEVGDLQEPAGAVPARLPRQRLPVRPPPADGGHGAEGGKGGKVTLPEEGMLIVRCWGCLAGLVVKGFKIIKF